MLVLENEKNIEVAVIGESGVGKSTWIAGLTTKEIKGELLNKTEENFGGQTKIGIHYKLVNPEKKSEPEYYFHWNKEGLKQYYLKKIIDKTINDSVGIISALNKLGITDYVTSVIDNNVISNDSSDKDDTYEIEPYKVRKALDEYLQSEDYKTKIREIDLFKEIVNKPDLNMDVEIRLIHYISVEVPAAPIVWQKIEEAGFNSVTLCDTRGFLDGIKTDIMRSEEWSNEKYADYMLADRGIFNAHACIYFDSGAINRPTKEVQETYYPLIKKLLCANPFIVVKRSNNIRKYMLDEKNALNEDDGKLYEEAKESLDKDADSDVHNSIIDTVIDEIIGNEKDLQTMIRLNNRESVIAARKSSEESEDEVWLKTCVGVFDDLLNAIKKDMQYINSRCDVYNGLISDTDKLIAAFQHLYEDEGEFCIGKAIKYWYRNEQHSHGIDEYYSRLLKPLKGEEYTFLGIRGGYRSKIPLSERHAINILESAYDERYKRIIPLLIEMNSEILTEKMRQYNISFEDLKAELNRCKEKESHQNISCFSRAGLLVNIEYFEKAFRLVRKKYNISTDDSEDETHEHRAWFENSSHDWQDFYMNKVVESFFKYLVFYDKQEELTSLLPLLQDKNEMGKAES